MKGLFENILNSKVDNNNDALKQGKEYSNLQNNILTNFSVKLPDLENSTLYDNETIIETLETNNQDTTFNDNNDQRAENLNSLKELQNKYNNYITELRQLTADITSKEHHKDDTNKDIVQIKNKSNLWLGCQLNKLYQSENDCKDSCFTCQPQTFYTSETGQKNWNSGQSVNFYQFETNLYETSGLCYQDNSKNACTEFKGTIITKSNEEKKQKIKKLRTKIKNVNSKIQELTHILNKTSEELYNKTRESDNIINNQNNNFKKQSQQINYNKKNVNGLLINKQNLLAQLEDIKLNRSSNNMGYILWLIAAATLGGIVVTRMINK